MNKPRLGIIRTNFDRSDYVESIEENSRKLKSNENLTICQSNKSKVRN